MMDARQLAVDRNHLDFGVVLAMALTLPVSVRF
jgi:hypothetical protein